MSREMKDSGVEWLGQIPQEWFKVKVKDLVKIVGGNGFPIKLQGKRNGDYPFYKNSDLNVNGPYINSANNYLDNQIVEQKKYSIIPKNSIIMSKIGESMKKNHRKINIEACLIDNNIQALVSKNIIDTNYKYLYYLMTIIDSNWFDNRGTVPSINNNAFKNQIVFIPDESTQSIIANFLDRKTTEIDTIVDKTKQSIEELKAYKQSLITETVTKGLNPDVPMKDSGIEWISKIPEHWEVNLGKRIFNREERPKLDEEGVITAFRDGEVTLRENRRTEGFTHSSKEIGYQGIRKGDLVIHGMDAFAGAIGVSDSNGKSSPVYIVLSSSENINNYYYAYLLKVYAWNGYIESMATGIRQRSTDFRYSTFSMTPLVQPTIEEQNKIVEFLNKRNQQIDNLVSKKEKMIKELESYKQSLTYEYVTGKKEVE